MPLNLRHSVWTFNIDQLIAVYGFPSSHRNHEVSVIRQLSIVLVVFGNKLKEWLSSTVCSWHTNAG